MKRITPLPPLEQTYYVGVPSYEGTPTFQQLELEIKERAYFLWQKFGWDEMYCWCVAEKALFDGLEEIGFDSIGYRVYVFGEGVDCNGCDWKVKIITPEFPVVFIRYDTTEPTKVMCHPPTLCSSFRHK